MNKVISVIAVSGVLCFSSCKDDEVNLVSQEQNAAISDQSVTEAYFNEAGDLTIQAFNAPTSDEIASGGRSKGAVTLTIEGDTRFNGAIVTLLTTAENEPLNPEGIITVDFGAGQTDPRGTVRKGVIIINYQGLRFVPGSKTITTFDDYHVNGVKIEGTRTITTSTFSASPNLTISFIVKDNDGKATFSDQTTITRNATHTITFVNTSNGITWTIEGQANGEARRGESYVFLIERPLIFKSSCALSGFSLPSEGEALFTVDSFPVGLNYGDEGAACDNILTVTINDVTQNITVNN